MDVVAHQFDGLTTLHALPLAAGLVVAAARADPWLRVNARFGIRTDRLAPDAVVGAYSRPDVLAFSSYVWNERYSLEVARRARRRFPGTFILFGGPSVPRQPARAAAFLREHSFVDALAFGEGELAFTEVLRALGGARSLESVSGLALRSSASAEGARLTAPRGRIAQFDTLASPYLDGTFDAMLAERGGVNAAILETNRGCPFACTFCDWGQATASRVHELPMERLHEELAWTARRRIPYLYIVDANFGIRPRDIEIVREMGRLRASTGYPQYVYFHLTKNATERHLEVVLALREAGIGTHLALATQDFDARVLKAVKRDNIRLERALELRRICNERGIPTFNELILGLPEQTYDSFAAGMARAVTPYPQDVFQLYLARMLENAQMASAEDRARYGLETRPVTIGSHHHESLAQAHVEEVEEIVVATRAMPRADWLRAFKLGYFLAAAHNLRLLDAVLQVARREAGVELRAFLEALLARMARAEPGSALRAVDDALDRHGNAIQRGRTMALPHDLTGDHLWGTEDTVLIVALTAGSRFYSGIAQFVREELSPAAAPLIEEAVRYQEFITPTPGAGVRRAVFDYDFPTWRALSGTGDAPVLERRHTALMWAPAAAVADARDTLSFTLAYLGAVHARQPTGYLTQDPSARASTLRMWSQCEPSQ